MAVRYDGGRESGKPKYIEDVAPVGRTGFDTRYDKTRQQSIGRLDQEYLRSRAFVEAEEDYGGGIRPARPPQPKRGEITRIPPMETLHSGTHFSDGTSTVAVADLLSDVGHALNVSAKAVG